MRVHPRMLLGWISAILLGCALAGCGADQNGDQISAPLSVSSAVSTPVASRSASTGTTGDAGGGTQTTPVGTTAESRLPGYQKPPVLIGDMNTPEQFILGELYAWALRAQGYRVAVSRNIGAPTVTQEAMRQGSLDVYPDYLNQFNAEVAKNSSSFDTLHAALKVARAYAHDHGLVLLDPTPFSDTTGLAVSSWFARENHIWSLPQLAHGPDVIVGAPPQYTQAADGLPAIDLAYGLHPALVRPIAIGQQYDALSNNEIQAAYVQTTDPELDGQSYRVLQDPLHAAGIGNVVPVTTPRVIQREGPEFVRTLDRVDALLTLSVMRGLNAEVQIDNADPGLVAEEFLQANGLVPPTANPGGG